MSSDEKEAKKNGSNILVAGDRSLDFLIYQVPTDQKTDGKDEKVKGNDGKAEGADQEINSKAPAISAALYASKNMKPLTIAPRFGGVDQLAEFVNQLVEPKVKVWVCREEKIFFSHIFQLKAAPIKNAEKEQRRQNPCGLIKIEDRHDPIRVNQFLGYSTDLFNQDFSSIINIDAINERSDSFCTKHVDNDFADFDPVGVLIHDAGTRFKDNANLKEFLTVRLGNPKDGPRIILLKKINEIKDYGESIRLKEYLEKYNHNLIIVTNLYLLRVSGANISYGLSWEKTLTDFVWQIEHNPKLKMLRECAVLVVRVGYAGAIIYVPNTETSNPCIALRYDSCSLEGFFEERNPGEMIATTSIFTAILFADLLKELENDKKSNSINKLMEEKESQESFIKFCSDSVCRAIMVLRKIHEEGYNLSENLPNVVYDVKSKISEMEKKHEFSTKIFARVGKTTWLEVKKFKEKTGFDKPDGDWSIFNENRDENIGTMAYTYVTHGTFKKPSGTSDDSTEPPPFPFYRMGNISTVNRGEIESFQSIRNLLREYLKNPSTNVPLSIAVFGPPGAGKSFGIKEIAKEFQDHKIESLTFNLSQFTSTDYLIAAFHRIRDIVLEGKVPLVFFDEFDSPLNGKEIGWLKYFLVPMQDGEFMAGESMHPIGRAIFIFAGGTYVSYQKLTEHLFEPKEGDPDFNKKYKDYMYFRSAKLPDFISRLRGYINIVGCNPVGKSQQYKITRAILLRDHLKKRAPEIFNDNGCQIDRNVLRAFIKIKRYYHGVRSMKAIIEMSNLSGKKSFGPAALPPIHQLDLHVNGKQFMHLVLRNTHYYEEKETMVDQVETSRTKKELNCQDIEALQLYEHIPAIFSIANFSILKDAGDEVDDPNTENGESLFDEIIDNKKIDDLKRQIQNDWFIYKEKISLSGWNEPQEEIIYSFFGISKERETEMIIADMKKLQTILKDNKFKLYPL